MASSECAVGDILATIDEVEVDAEAMEELSNELPSFDESVKRIQRDTESEEAIQLVDKWRKLLKLESKNGALPGTREKLPQLLQRLNEIEMEEESSDERVLIYHLLSSVGNLESQKALLDMLKVHSDSYLEVTSLLVEIALMPSVHSSTVDSLISQYESLKSNDYVANQLILSLGTLGRHTNVEDKIVKYLSVKLTSAMTPEETSVLIHALGNTASKKIIPILEPFISDDTYQSYTIDALRGVSMDGAVQKEFTTLVTESLHPQVVLEVVESLTSPFKNSLYSFKIKKDYDASQDLKSALIIAGIKYKEDELTNSLKEYFTAINDKTSKKILQKGLESNNVAAGRQKRATTSRNWSSSSNRNYNLIESLLIFKIGMGVTASLSYHITPEASTTVCDTSPKGDANACFEVYSITTGRIYLKAFWQKRKTKCYWKWGPRCKIYWSGRKTFRPLSKTWNLFSRKKKLFGVCRVCECYGNHFLNVICHGNKSGSSTCACRTQISRG
ncbi:PREDICTED: uncharacterized protein LOC109586801 [Amphimedon queenslandica]|uniref:Vitellogenin domain-containing protein n=1 Tax=Amphimedon queenslandica TaxID=400682 RepID=A0AAN0JP18_AMPQE|nr:PREDICTED: uncharacterized protein LOC109586801 [Amphimedon queenslandica]|eukprot:XP_019858574.1 PREDICTED: uncharacterized protein LOC109586801 [Amphimedon queenslandica]